MRAYTHTHPWLCWSCHFWLLPVSCLVLNATLELFSSQNVLDTLFQSLIAFQMLTVFMHVLCMFPHYPHFPSSFPCTPFPLRIHINTLCLGDKENSQSSDLCTGYCRFLCSYLHSQVGVLVLKARFVWTLFSSWMRREELPHMCVFGVGGWGIPEIYDDVIFGGLLRDSNT